VNRKPSEEKRSLSRKRLRTNSPSCKGNEQKGSDKEKKAGNSEQNNPYEIYFRSDLGQNFIQTVGKTEQIRENLSNFVAEMDERVTLEFAKTKASV